MSDFATKIDVMNPIWNRDTWARLQGDLDPSKTNYIASKGTVMGVEEGKAVQPLCGFEATLATRLEPQEVAIQNTAVLNRPETRRKMPTRTPTVIPDCCGA